MKIDKCVKGHYYPVSYNNRCNYCVAQFGIREAKSKEKKLKDYLEKKYKR